MATSGLDGVQAQRPEADICSGGRFVFFSPVLHDTFVQGEFHGRWLLFFG
ncbi:hypothetical protein [Sphingomonas edaphi]|nr:hypothetical protein [Sphingomonas edaphi]